MDQHQGRKGEIDGREESFAAVIKMGEELLAKNHYASDEVNNWKFVPEHRLIPSLSSRFLPQVISNKILAFGRKTWRP